MKISLLYVVAPGSLIEVNQPSVVLAASVTEPVTHQSP
jgi:hypothetical protein